MGDMRFGLEVMLIGFAGVFIALFILFLLLVLMDKVFTKKNRKTPKPDTAVSSKGKEDVKPSPAPAAAVETADSENANELVAVISAALSVYMKKPQTSFAIRSINPVRSTNSWAYYGRTRIMDLKSNMGSKRREKR